MEDHRDWSRIGTLALVVAVLYALLLARVVQLAANGLAPVMNVCSSVTALIREGLGVSSAKVFVGLISFCYWAFALAVPLLPLLAVRQPVPVKLALTAPALLLGFVTLGLLAGSVAFAAPVIGSCVLVAVVSVALRRFQPNNSSKPTQLRDMA